MSPTTEPAPRTETPTASRGVLTRMRRCVRLPVTGRRGSDGAGTGIAPGQRGFSLAEVLVVVGLIGIIVLFSTPALLDFFRSMKVRTAAQRVVSNMRLARQVAVSRRNHVTMVIEASDTSPTYRAWEDTELDNTRDANGVDNVAGNDDDEPWVVEPDQQLEINQVKLPDVYNDTTPNTANDQFTASDSVLEADATVTLRFFPNGQVQRIGTDGTPVATDTLLRVRMDGTVGPDRLDRWYAGVNRPGKVQTDFIRDPDWE